MKMDENGLLRFSSPPLTIRNGTKKGKNRQCRNDKMSLRNVEAQQQQ
jgi:hypothetical protein